jgi:hypothetical protein
LLDAPRPDERLETPRPVPAGSHIRAQQGLPALVEANHQPGLNARERQPDYGQFKGVHDTD